MCSVCSVCSVRCPYSGHLFIMSTSERLTQQTAHTAHMSSVRVSRHVQNRFMSIFIPMIHYQFVVRYDIRVHCLLMTLPENVRCTNRSFVVLVNTTTENCADIRRRIDLPWERNSENTQQQQKSVCCFSVVAVHWWFLTCSRITYWRSSMHMMDGNISIMYPSIFQSSSSDSCSSRHGGRSSYILIMTSDGDGARMAAKCTIYEKHDSFPLLSLWWAIMDLVNIICYAVNFASEKLWKCFQNASEAIDMGVRQSWVYVEHIGDAHFFVAVAK